MSYGNNKGAIGYLVGKEHSGLRYMFSMMNHARQSVGVQGLGISECAFQGALHYATSRIQGSDAAGNKLTIASYGDVRRMLMLMKSGTEAMRALCYFSALIDDQKNAAIKQHKASEEIAGFDASIGFLTPIVKGWCTELAQELVSLAMQVYGGAGYVEETGVAQHVRDARILTIYEGTTGIQALDFSIRKTLLDGGAQAEHFFSKIHQTIALLATLKGSDNLHLSLSSALDDAQNAVKWLTENPQHANSVAANYLQLWGYLMGGWLMAKSFIVAQSQLQNKASDKAYLQAKLMTCKFYTEHFLVRTKACLASISAGGDTIMSLTEQQFFSHVN
jgi:hypothetical protein